MNKYSSVFGQILSLFPRAEFEASVRKTRVEKHSKGFSSWTQFVSMLFCQIGQAHSLREICNGLATCTGKLNHLGIKKSPNKSTLAYANEHRSWELFRDLFYLTLDKCQKQTNGKKAIRIKNKLLSFDTSMIELCTELFDWAKYKRTKGAVKLHLLLDHEGYFPVFANITEGIAGDTKVLKTIDFKEGSIIAIDRGCLDYGLFHKWTQEGVFFVTRMKSNAGYVVIKRQETPKVGNVLKDEIIELKWRDVRKKCPGRMRRIEVWNEERQEVIIFLTNNFKFSARTIARIYKDRWQIEIFFKMLKQNLKIKTFIGTSSNALNTQIWTALIAILLIKYLQVKSRHGWALSNMVMLIRLNLFTYRDLWGWLDNPFSTPPIEPQYIQMNLW